MLMVVALGGNSVSPPGREGTIPEQFATTREAVRPLANLLLAGHQLVITHGNGPQVGNVMRRVEIAAQQHVYPIPLDTAVADTQAGMGYMISQCLMNELAAHGQSKTCTTIVTTVRVDADDPALTRPSKPVGAWMSKEHAEKHAKQDGWNVVEDAGAAGGAWSLPLCRAKSSSWGPFASCSSGPSYWSCAAEVEFRSCATRAGNIAVSKPLSTKIAPAPLLAIGIGAEVFVILTGVDQVQSDYGTPKAQALERISIGEARKMLVAGQFPPGSMGPKIQAAIDYLEQSTGPRSEVIITSSEQIEAALAGKNGTRIVIE